MNALPAPRDLASPDSATTVARIQNDLRSGAPWAACDAFRAANGFASSDPALLYWGALAFARSGATRQARALIDRIGAAADVPADIRRETLCLSGRLWKDRIDRIAGGPERVGVDALRAARDDYLAAHAVDAAAYPAANAATLSMLLGDRPQAERLADEVAARLASQTAPWSAWDEATMGEASLLLGDVDAACRSYERACDLARDDTGSVASMRGQLIRLERVLPAARRMLDLLPAPGIIAFAGHMIDRPDRAAARFPASLEAAVAAHLGERLVALHRPIVYTSAACGSDLLFVEAALAVGAEVNIVLPFDREDFVASSVAFAGAGWVARFDAALARATRVVQATEERYLGDDVLFAHAQALVGGLALLRATQLQTLPMLWCVLDHPDVASHHVGGTHAALDQWARTTAPAEIIALRSLDKQRPAAATAPATPDAQAALVDRPAERPQRTLKTTLFADVAGFGRLHDAHAPLFHARFLGLVSAQMADCPTPPLAANTWGDALYVVFSRPQDGAAFALGLIERMSAVDWAAAGLSDTSHIRVALHAGPVFCGFDPIMDRDNYFGTSVTQTARIEPITPPGVVYASEAFVATLAMEGPSPFVFEYVGELELAKAHGRSRIYRVEQR